MESDVSPLLLKRLDHMISVDSSMTRSISDLNAITVEVDSANSSPGLIRVRL